MAQCFKTLHCFLSLGPEVLGRPSLTTSDNHPPSWPPSLVQNDTVPQQLLRGHDDRITAFAMSVSHRLYRIQRGAPARWLG